MSTVQTVTLTNGTIGDGVSIVTTTEIPRRPTLRAVASATITRWTLGCLTSVIPANEPGVWFGRGLIATIMAAGGSMPAGAKIIPVRTPRVRGEWVLGPGVQFGSRAGYYVHGSAFVLCSTATHRKLVARLSEATGLPFFVVDYRLAPRYRFPAAAEDVEAGYRWLLELGYAGSDVVIGADSAGGHLTCDMLLAHARHVAFQPAAVVLFSPLIDLTMTLAKQQEKTRRDPAMSADAAARMVGLYTRGQDPLHVRLRLRFTDAQLLPPMLIQVGSFEMLSADARHLHAELQKSGGRSTLEVWPGMVHVFQALPKVAPEATAALRRAAAFVAEHLADGQHRVDELQEMG